MMSRIRFGLLAVLMMAGYAMPASAGASDDAWAQCIWRTVPTSASNWLAMPQPERRPGIGETTPEFALQYRLQAACYEALTSAGKSSPPSFDAKKVRKSLLKIRPAAISPDTVEPMAFRCSRYFLNDTEMRRPAAFRWGFGTDTSKAQFFSMSFIFAAQGGGSVGLPDEGGLEKCQYVEANGTFRDA